MEAVKRALLNWWTVTITIVVLLLLLLVVALPIFVPFMRPWWIRLIIVVVIGGVWGIFAFLRLRKARAAADAIAKELAASQAGGAESAELAKRMTEALAGFKTATGNKRDYLYSRPWYVIIGPPGAGKTTALLNSGLRFPFSEQAYKGVGGTRNLDFWFADEAVLIDTAGRYTTQDSHGAKDANAWTSFLGLLKKNRPLQPINGVLVAIGLDEIITADQAQIDQHAATVRRRLSEIRQSLELSVPVYVLFTKADLLAGFSEYFEDLDVEGRRAVFGETFTYDKGLPQASDMTAAFDTVAQSIADRQAKRLSDDQDMRRRSLILGFPAQFTAIRARIVRFLEGAFVASDEPVGQLRGFYLTSGVQQGAPLDRLLSGLGEVYDQPQTTPSGGRAYFLNRLLGEVVFPEAGLVQMEPKARVRVRSQLMIAFGAIAAVSVVVLVLWTISFIRNHGLQNDLDKQSLAAAEMVKDQGIDLVEVGPNDADLEQSVGVLDNLRALSRGYADRKKGGAPLTMGFGLYQNGHSQRADLEYREGLRRILLPRLLLRLEDFMRTNINSPLDIYDPLKSYLMLGGQKPGAIDADTIKGWVESDWENNAYPGSDRADLRRRLALHLDALLSDKDLQVSWPNHTAPLDSDLINQARAAVQTLSLSDRAYAILYQKATAASGAPWLASTVLSSGDAVAFTNGDEVLNMKVPYFFTRAGYEKAYQTGLITIQNDLEKDLWVLGSDANTSSVKEQIGEIRPGVAAHYVRDYEAAWDKVIATPKPADYFNNAAAFGAFTRSPSPLKLILLEVVKNADFTGGTRAATAGATAALKSKMGAASAVLSSGAGSIDAGQSIQLYYKPVRDYVGDGKLPAPIDDFMTALKSAGQAVIASKSIQGGAGSDAVQAQTATATAAMAGAAAGAPPGLQGFMGDAVKGGSAAQTSAAEGAVTSTYVADIFPSCQTAAQEKYPFFSNSKIDVTTLDAIKVFGPGGTMDAFVQQKLTPLLDTGGPGWRWKSDNPVAANFNPSTADDLSRLAQMRDMLSTGVSFKVQAASFGPDVDTIEFSSGGTTYVFNATTKDAQPVIWTVQGLPAAHVTLSKGGQQVAKFDGDGPWALFRVMDNATRQNAGTDAFIATFGQGGKTASLKFALGSTFNPFSKGGIWTFRCPVAL